MTLHHSLRDLVAARGPDVVSDAGEFRAVLDDFLAEDEVTTGDLNVLVDAVRLGAVARLVDLLDHGSDPVAAVGEAGTALARDRGSDDPGRSLRAVAVLGFALGRVGEPVVQEFMSDGKPSAPTTARRPRASGPDPAPASTPAPAEPGPRAAPRWVPVLVAVVVLLLIVAGGALGWVLLGGESPEDAVDDLFSAGSCEEELEHLTGEHAAYIQGLLDSDDPFCVHYEDFDSVPEHVGIDEDGDRATAVVKGTQQYDGDDASIPAERPFTAVLELQRSDGDWRVSQVDWTFTDE